MEENALKHFGILGMHWGDKNGPPYPLGKSQLSGEESKKNPGGSNDQQREELTPEQQAAAKRSTHLIKEAHRAGWNDMDYAQRKQFAKNQNMTDDEYDTLESQMDYHTKKQAKEAARAEKKAEKKQEKREEKLYAMSAAELLDHTLEYTPEEIDSAMTRIKQKQALMQLSIQDAKNEQAESDQNVAALNRPKQYIDTIVGYGNTAINVYDTIAKLSGKPTLADVAKKKLADMDAQDKKILERQASDEIKKLSKSLDEFYKDNEDSKANDLLSTLSAKKLQEVADYRSAQDKLTSSREKKLSDETVEKYARDYANAVLGKEDAKSVSEVVQDMPDNLTPSQMSDVLSSAKNLTILNDADGKGSLLYQHAKPKK